jgi:tryptophan synthase alpha chain
MNRIDAHFAKAAQEGRKSLIPFITAGFPSLELTEEIVLAIDEAGGDVLEMGIPFSDPVADGPTIQASSTDALRAGATLAKILDLVERVRSRTQIPILLFGAFNPFLHYGLESLMARSVEVGVDGFLVPDFPCEESAEFEGLCRGADLDTVHLVAPTTPPDRMRMIARRSTGFVYYVSMKGVTGATISITSELQGHVQVLREASSLPVAVGFGIRTPEHVAQVAAISDAVVVGSELVRRIGEDRNQRDLAEKVGSYIRSLKSAL